MYLLKLGDKYVSQPTGHLSPRQRDAFRFPDDLIPFTAVESGYLKVSTGYRWVKLRARTPSVASLAHPCSAPPDRFDASEWGWGDLPPNDGLTPDNRYMT